MRPLIGSVLCGLLLCLGCAGGEGSAETSLAVDVADDQGRALGGVPILLDDTPVAKTDGGGRARAFVRTDRAGRVRVKAQCPSDYRDAAARSVPVPRAETQARPLTLRVTCAPKLRTLAVVMRAPGGEGLTLRADGAPVAQVAPDGTAHVVLQRAPDTRVRLSLDTAEAPSLVPQFPAREVHVTDRDEIVVFDQALAVRPPRKPRGHKPARSRGPRHVPYAIRRSR